MNHPLARTAEVDVGEPQYTYDGWTTCLFNFHGFEGLSIKKGRAVKSNAFHYAGNDWYVNLYPGGALTAKEDMISVNLLKTRSHPQLAEFAINVLDWDGELATANGSSGERSFTSCWGYFNFIRRSTVLDPSKNILVAGTLVVQVQIKVRQQMSRPCLPFFPVIQREEKLKELFDVAEKYADVIFEFPKHGGSKCHAHRAALQAWAPGFADICQPYVENSTPVPVENVSPVVFKLLLSYVYGVPVSVSDWKLHAKELLEAADFYNIPSLKVAAEQWYRMFSPAKSSEQVMELWAYAEARNCSELKESAMDFFVEKGVDAIALSGEKITNPGSAFSSLLQAMSINKADDGLRDPTEYKLMRVSSLRRELAGFGLDVDGSRETLVKRLEAFDDEDASQPDRSEGNAGEDVDADENGASEDEDEDDEEES